MLRGVRAVARLSVREALAERALYGAGGVFGGLLGLAWVLGDLTVGGRLKVLQDFALTASLTLADLVAAFLGTSALRRELDRGSICFLLSRPLTRGEVLWGKWLGMSLALLALVGGMAVASLAVLAPLGGARPGLLVAWGLIAVEATLILALAMFFATFCGFLTALLAVLSLFVVGHLVPELGRLAGQVREPQLALLLRALRLLLPNLTAFDVKAAVVHGLPLPAARLWLPVPYGLAYAASLLVGASLIWERRDVGRAP